MQDKASEAVPRFRERGGRETVCIVQHFQSVLGGILLMQGGVLISLLVNGRVSLGFLVVLGRW